MTIRLLSYVLDGRLGGRPSETFERAVEAIDGGVTVIAAQGTGMDAGPFYLGHDDTLAIERAEIEPILLAAKRTSTPFVFSCGGAGGDLHLLKSLRLINKLCAETGTNLKIAIISGEVDKEYLKQKVRSGVKIRRSMDTPRLAEFLTEEEIDRSKRIVSQMGPEPVMSALDEGVDGVITGRALDVGIHMAPLLREGVSRGQAAHIGKLVECASLVCEPTNSYEFVLAEIENDLSFTLTPLSPNLRCTTRAIKTHSLYEREDPNIERNPGGLLDVTNATYEQISDRTVRCAGGLWVDAPYTVKLEGAASVGYQTFSLFGIRDPAMIAHLDEIEADIQALIKKMAGDETYDMTVHAFGRDGVLGTSEPLRDIATPHEVALLVTITASTQESADRLANGAWLRYFFADFPGRKTTAGNTASPQQRKFAPLGEVYEFNIWHLMPLDDPGEPFRRHIIDFPVNEAELETMFSGKD